MIHIAPDMDPVAGRQDQVPGPRQDTSGSAGGTCQEAEAGLAGACSTHTYQGKEGRHDATYER